MAFFIVFPFIPCGAAGAYDASCIFIFRRQGVDDEQTDLTNHANCLPPLLAGKLVWPAYAQGVLENELGGHKIQSMLAKVFLKLSLIPSPAHKCTLVEATIM
jgi:hypothetical protein